MKVPVGADAKDEYSFLMTKRTMKKMMKKMMKRRRRRKREKKTKKEVEAGRSISMKSCYC